MTDLQDLNKETTAAVHPAVERVGLLRQWMLERGYAALIVPTADPHGSEYLPERWKVRQWLTGFTGSAKSSQGTNLGIHHGADEISGDGDQGDQDALCLVGLSQFHGLSGILSAADDNGNTGDIVDNQGQTQVTDEGVGQEAHLGLSVGLSTVQVLQNFQELCAQSGSDTAVENVLQTLVAGHHGLNIIFQSSLQLAQVVDLLAGDGVVAGQVVCGAGECNRLALAVLGDSGINGGYGTSIVVVVTAKNSIKKCHGFSSYKY